MLCIIIKNKLHYEKLHVHFGCILILSNDVFHGGCMGSPGSFRFHVEIKVQNKRGSERLMRNFYEWTSQFYESFPSIEIGAKPIVNDEIENILKK